MLRGLAALVLAVIALVCASAQAATHQFDLTINEQARTFDVWGSVSGGDNAGMASFVVDLLNIDTARVVAPKGFDRDELRLKGFVTISPALTGDGTVYGYQNLSDPNSLILGIGQTAGSLPVYPGSSYVGIPWAAPVHLATGTYSGPELPVIGTTATADVFTHIGSTELQTAGIYLPEPASCLLLAIGGAMALCRRR
jgi:hypothetical protein